MKLSYIAVAVFVCATPQRASSSEEPASSITVDDTCKTFCDNYFSACIADHNNAYLAADDAVEECNQTCMSWPRGVDPATFSDQPKADVFNSNLGSVSTHLNCFPLNVESYLMLTVSYHIITVYYY